MDSTHTFSPAPSLDIRHLKLVRAIAKEASVTRAARHLFLSQSAVSHQLIELERELRVKLFHRIGKRMVPSTSGETLIKASERLLNELAQVESDLRDVTRAARYTLRVTTSCYTSYQWLPSVASAFDARHPKVEVRIVVEATRRALEALVADEVDLAIVSRRPPSEVWACAPLTTSELVVLSSPRHLWPSRRVGPPRAVRANDLSGAVLFVHDLDPEDRERLESTLRAAISSNQPQPDVRTVPLTEALVELVRANQGVAVTDRWMIESYLGKELVASPLRPRVRRPFYAVWRKANPRGLPLQELATLIRNGRSAAPPRLSG